MSKKPQKKYGTTYTNYGAASEYKHTEVSAFQKKLNETYQLAKENEDIGIPLSHSAACTLTCSSPSS